MVKPKKKGKTWSAELVAAVLAGRSEPGAEGRVDSLLRWLAGIDTPDAKAIANAFWNQGVERDEAEPLALAFLDTLLFRRDNHDPFHILGLAPGTDKDAIQARYRRLIQIFHPDRARGDLGWMNDRTDRLNRAYNQLKQFDFRRTSPRQPPIRPPTAPPRQPVPTTSYQPGAGTKVRRRLGNARRFQQRFFAALILIAAGTLTYVYMRNTSLSRPQESPDIQAVLEVPGGRVVERGPDQAGAAPRTQKNEITPGGFSTDQSAANPQMAETASIGQDAKSEIPASTELRVAAAIPRDQAGPGNRPGPVGEKRSDKPGDHTLPQKDQGAPRGEPTLEKGAAPRDAEVAVVRDSGRQEKSRLAQTAKAPNGAVRESGMGVTEQPAISAGSSRPVKILKDQVVSKAQTNSKKGAGPAKKTRVYESGKANTRVANARSNRARKQQSDPIGAARKPVAAVPAHTAGSPTPTPRKSVASIQPPPRSVFPALTKELEAGIRDLLKQYAVAIREGDLRELAQTLAPRIRKRRNFVSRAELLRDYKPRMLQTVARGYNLEILAIRTLAAGEALVDGRYWARYVYTTGEIKAVTGNVTFRVSGRVNRLAITGITRDQERFTNSAVDVEIRNALNEYSNAYRSGDINRFMKLFGTNPVENKRVGYHVIRGSYVKLFESTKSRRLTFKVDEISPARASRFLVKATYKADLKFRSGKKFEKKSPIRIWFQLTEDGLKISRTEY